MAHLVRQWLQIMMVEDEEKDVIGVNRTLIITLMVAISGPAHSDPYIRYNGLGTYSCRGTASECWRINEHNRRAHDREQYERARREKHRNGADTDAAGHFDDWADTHERFARDDDDDD